MDTIIIATLIGLGIAAELTLGQPQLWATGAGILAAAVYMLIAVLVLMARRRPAEFQILQPGGFAGAEVRNTEAGN